MFLQRNRVNYRGLAKSARIVQSITSSLGELLHHGFNKHNRTLGETLRPLQMLPSHYFDIVHSCLMRD